MPRESGNDKKKAALCALPNKKRHGKSKAALTHASLVCFTGLLFNSFLWSVITSHARTTIKHIMAYFINGGGLKN